MRQLFLALILVSVTLMNAYSQDAEGLAASWEKEHISNIFPSDVRHADLKKYLSQLAASGISVTEVGRSYANREIFQVEWGQGPLKVFLWSQMHGDEPTATSALVDMFAFLQKNREIDWVRKLSDAMTIRAVPMLNPDGAEIYQRRNAQGIDINRDALELKTPEGQLLKRLRDDWNPAIGFNLHNQGALTTAGRTSRQASISLLVVLGDEAKTITAGHERNQRISAAIVTALQKFIPGHIARYSDEWTPTAFGDNFSAWGTPTILIETGALYGKDEMFLVKMNFVAFLTALNSIATGSERSQDPNLYVNLPENSSGGLVDFVFRGANIIDPSNPGKLFIGDITAVTARRRASFAAPVMIRSISAFANVRGLVEYDASGYNLVHRFGRTAVGELAEFYFYRRDRLVDWKSPEIESRFPPDAIFSTGKWIRGEKLLPQR
jgi:hypothetical protein